MDKSTAYQAVLAVHKALANAGRYISTVQYLGHVEATYWLVCVNRGLEPWKSAVLIYQKSS